jgi:hypothetical protein
MGTTFQQGTYNFNFTTYDALSGGTVCWSNSENLTTGYFGEWKTEQTGVSASCNNASNDYFLSIRINGVDQPPRRRLSMFSYMRKDVDERTLGSISVGQNSTVISPAAVLTDIVRVKVGLKDLNQEVWQKKILYSQESANTTLTAQEALALAYLTAAKNISSASVGESVELKKTRLITSADLAKAIIESNAQIARAKIVEARELAKLNGETSADLEAIEDEADLRIIALNLTAAEKRGLIDAELTSSLQEVEANDDGIRFCLSNGTNCNMTQGPKGDTGDSGPQGIQGIPGINGTNGLDGVDLIAHNQAVNTTSNVTFNTLNASKIRGSFWSVNNSQGITNITYYTICIVYGANGKCDATCTLQILNGLITGCV